MAAAPTSASPSLRALGPIARYEQEITDRIEDFKDPRQEWRRLFSELLGTFFLVLAAAGGGMMGHAFPGVISHTDAVVAPALTVMAIILFMGKVSGAHLNPAVSFAFALRHDFPWKRVPGYIVVQLAGATLGALFLHAVINVSATYGSNYVAATYSAGSAFWMEFILTLGLVSVILGTASGAQNVGLFGAFGVGGYIALAGLWGSPISGASMNPARTFGPDLVGGNFSEHREPSLDHAALVFGVHLVEHRLADHVLVRVPEHLRERRVAVQDLAMFVLHDRGKARCGRR